MFDLQIQLNCIALNVGHVGIFAIWNTFLSAVHSQNAVCLVSLPLAGLVHPVRCRPHRRAGCYLQASTHSWVWSGIRGNSSDVTRSPVITLGLRPKLQTRHMAHTLRFNEISHEQYGSVWFWTQPMRSEPPAASGQRSGLLWNIPDSGQNTPATFNAFHTIESQIFFWPFIPFSHRPKLNFWSTVSL